MITPIKIGSIVVPRWFIMGIPVGVPSDTRCVVREIIKRDKRARVERDDGRGGSWWVDFDAIRHFGEG
jgi:hypothetical protein